MNPYDKLVQEAANAPDEEMVDIFRSGWQRCLFWGALSALMIEDIANACSVTIDDEGRRKAAERVNAQITMSQEFRQFSLDVAHKRTSLKGIG